MHPARLLPFLQEEIRHAAAHQYIRPVGRHQDVPHLLPRQAQAHETAQKIPMGGVVRLVESAPQAPHRRFVRPIHPVRQKVHLPALGALIAAPEGKPLPGTQGLHQLPGQGLLMGGEKSARLRHIPAAAALPAVP